jgi:hypothetical protein
MLTEHIDLRARRPFSLYHNKAKRNGYGFQAYLIETKILPKVRSEIAVAEAEMNELLAKTQPKVQKRGKGWRWKERASAIGMGDQHDFVYAYTSRLLHATPSSLTTNQKNLEPDEFRMFLDFIYVSILDLIELADRLSGRRDRSLN